MSSNSWVEAVAFDTADGSALTGSTAATSLLPGPAKFTLPANYFNFVGKKIRLRAAGIISTVVTTPGTLLLDFRLGAVVAFSGGAMALNIVAKTNVTWLLELELTARAIGAGTSAALLGSGRFSSEAVVGSPLPTVGGSGQLLLPASAMANGTGFDSTAAQQIDLFGTWSINNADSITVKQFSFELMN